MKRFGKVVAVSAAALVLFAGCASDKGASEKPEKTKTEKSEKKDKGGKEEKGFDVEAFNALYAAGDYDGCVALLEQRGAGEVLDGLDSSMLAYLKKDYMGSAKSFVETQQTMQQLSADMTAGKVMEAALAGENSVTYSGSAYERILAYSMKAVDALKMGEVDRAVGVFNEYTGNYKAEIADLIEQQREIAAQSANPLEKDDVKSALSAMDKIGIKFDTSAMASKEASDDMYEASAFLSYLGALTYLANDDVQHAEDFAQVLASTGSAADLSADLAIEDGKGRLDVIALSDTIGKRSEGAEEGIFMTNILNSGIDAVYKIVYPTFEAQNHPIAVSKVTLSNGDVGEFTLIEDFDEAVKSDVAAKASGAIGRSIFRNIVKNSAAIAGSYAALQKADEQVQAAKNPVQKAAAQKAYEAALAGLNVALAAVIEAEKEDTRQAVFFPNKASAAGFTVEPGTYTVTVKYTNGKTDVIENVAVSAGKPTVVVSECMN